MELREAVVSDQHGAELTLVVPSTGIWGTAGIGGKNLDPGQRAAATDSVKKRAERVDRVVLPREVLLMKVDVGEAGGGASFAGSTWKCGGVDMRAFCLWPCICVHRWVRPVAARGRPALQAVPAGG